ncbi:MAG TPA: DUF1684 domain-containing protein [Terriglobia bacterium]|nr:DUF1684 domain-containing protein [Terriglobia bacterium]
MPAARILLAALTLLFLHAGPQGYRAEIELWRRHHQAALEAEDGWLTVVGLFWGKEGRNTVGADPTNDIVLPKGSAPAQVGVFEFHDAKTTFQAASGVKVTVNGQLLASAPLKPDTSGAADLLRIRDLTMFVIERGGRYAIRLKDKNSSARRDFHGLDYFPVNERYRVRAKFVPYRPPKKISIPNILGRTEEDTSPGYVVFTLDGREFRLVPVNSGDMLFFIFKDLTAGKETYPAGRFLYTALPEKGEVVLDFNKAVNPPCAVTAYATCPLPPKENILSVRIAAGEKRFGH